MTRIDIEFSVEKQKLTLLTKEPLRAKDENYFYAVFNLCEKWSNVSGIKASFVRDDLSFVIELTQGADNCLECLIPWELMTDKGEFYVGVFGGDRILTNTVRVDVAESCLCDGVAPQPPTPDWFTKIEDEILNFEPSEEVVAQAVEDYLTEHPIEVGATEEQATQIEANKQAITDIQNAGYITSVPDEYVTETELNSYGFLTEHQSLDEYAKKTDVATAVSDKVTMEDVHNATSGFVSEAYVDEKIAAIPEPDLSGYALKSEIPDVSEFITSIPDEYVTETELSAKGYLTEHQDLSNYALKVEIPDVSGFTTMSAVEEKGYQTAEQVQALINASLVDGEAVSY